MQLQDGILSGFYKHAGLVKRGLMSEEALVLQEGVRTNDRVCVRRTYMSSHSYSVSDNQHYSLGRSRRRERFIQCGAKTVKAHL